MNLHPRQRNLDVLPLVFYTEDGKIDSQLISNVWKASTQPLRKVKLLLGNSRGSGDRILELSERLEDVDFRSRWYDASFYKRRNSVPHFFHMVMRYTAKCSANLDWNDEKIKAMFDVIDEKRFPNLERIQDLAESICSEPQFPRESALFAWALMESSNYHVAHATGANRDLLESFPNRLRAALALVESDHLLPLLQVKNEFSLKKNEIVLPALPNLGAKKKVDSVLPSKLELEYSCIAGLIAELRQFRLKFNKSATQAGKISLQLASISASFNHCEDLSEIAETLKNLGRSISMHSDQLHSALKELTAKIMTDWAVLDKFVTPVIEPLSNEHWENNVESEVSKLREIERDIARLNAITNSNVLDSLRSEFRAAKYLTLSELGTQLETLLRTAQELIAIETSLERAREKILDNAQNLSWNATKDHFFLDEEWSALTACARRSSTFGTLTALLTRQTFNISSGYFIDAIQEKLSETDNSIFELVCAIGQLDYDQVEKIYQMNGDIEILVALAQLQNFCVENVLDKASSFRWWSREPLSNFVKHRDDSMPYRLTDRFFTAVYAEVTSNDVDILSTLVELCDNFNRQHQEPERYKEKYKHELEELLTYRPHGAGTYAALWRLAYQSIFDPLRRMLDSGHLEEVVPYIITSLSKIDIDDLYGEWLKSLPSHVWQESQYEKATKVYVSVRIGHVVTWCEVWSSQTSSLRRPHNALDVAVETVLTGATVEAEYIRKWMNRVVDLSSTAHDELRSNLPTSIRPIRATPYLPRSYLRDLSGNFPDWSVALTDELVNFFAGLTPIDLFARYREEKNIEALEHLCLLEPKSLLMEQIVSVNADVELETIKSAIKLGELKSKFAEAGSTQVDITSLDECQHFLVRRQWTKLNSSLGLLELLAEEAEKRSTERVKKARLVDEISALDGGCDSNLTVEELILKYENAYLRASARRRHVAPIDQLANTSGLSVELQNLAKRTVQWLGQAQNLPSEDVSELYAEALSLIVTPISEQLRRPGSLLPKYRAALERLVSWLLNNLLVEPLNSEIDAPFSNACLNIGERIKRIETATDIEKIIDDFADSGTYILEPLSPLDVELEIGPSLKSQIQETAIGSGESVFSHELGLKEVELLVVQISGWLSSLTIEGSEVHGGRDDRHHCIKNRNWERGLQLSLPLSDQDEDRLICAVICAFSIYQPPSDILVAGFAYLTLKSGAPPFSLIKAMRPEFGPVGKWFSVLFSSLLGGVPETFDETDQRTRLGAMIRQLSETPLLDERHAEITLNVSDNLRSFDRVVAHSGVFVQSLWDQFSGEKIQAEVRAGILIVFWKLKLFNCLAECLTMSPIDLDSRLAKGYVRLIQQAGEKLSADAVENLRRASSAKAYAIFAEKVFSELVRNVGLPATIRWDGPLERTTERSRWRGMLEVIPRSINPPLDIQIRFGSTPFLNLVGGKEWLVVNGPFFEAKTFELQLEVRLTELQRFDLDIDCIFMTVDGKTINSSLSIDTELSGLDEFKGAAPHLIDDAFASFPARHMRGAEFVARPLDEERVEKILFSGNGAGSLWIASPRRSGKTSMLFRILDAFSHNVDRDNAILYLTIDRHFESIEKFNQWVWSTLRSGKDNEGLRTRIDGLTRLGECLPFGGGAHDFIRALSELILEKVPSLNRVYFLFDEVDRLAEMQLAGGNLGSTVAQLMWQLRHVISSSPDVGIVFAGSSLARKFFVETSEAAFYNSIPRLELTPFSCFNSADAQNSRKIVMPARLHGLYKLPEHSLKHLLKITAGIPYYMKLVAGATYSVARQPTLLPTDVNRGLSAILRKSTGITRIDSLDNPGEDELRTLYASSDSDRALAKAILFAIAELRSPLDSRGIRLGELRSELSPLIFRYKLSREQIDRGVALCTDLGYLRRSQNSELEFTIPILGESIRHRCAVLWAEIEEKLEHLVR